MRSECAAPAWHVGEVGHGGRQLLAVIASAAVFALLVTAWRGGVDAPARPRTARVTMPLNPLAWHACPEVVRSVRGPRTKPSPGQSAGRLARLPSAAATPSKASSLASPIRTTAWPAVAAWMPVCRDL